MNRISLNSHERKNLIQEIALYLFSKYADDKKLIKEKLAAYGITISIQRLRNRIIFTSFLEQQDDARLLLIQQGERIHSSIIANPSYSGIVATLHGPKKIFISHSIKDKVVVGKTIRILEEIGIKSSQIYCSSYEGYGTPLGENYLDVLKNELQGDVLVLFILSENFFNSKLCLSEMGATWILSQNQIPIYIPPFGPEQVKGVFPTTQGLNVNNRHQITTLKKRLERDFEISFTIDEVIWSQKLDDILNDINISIQPN